MKVDEVSVLHAFQQARDVTDWQSFLAGYTAGVAAAADVDNADMFWDADDTETSYGVCLQEIADNLADNLSPHDGKVEITVQCAVSIPDVKLEVWVVDDDEERDVHYVVLA